MHRSRTGGGRLVRKSRKEPWETVIEASRRFGIVVKENNFKHDLL
jgi:hypothetical protein